MLKARGAARLSLASLPRDSLLTAVARAARRTRSSVSSCSIQPGSSRAARSLLCSSGTLVWICHQVLPSQLHFHQCELLQCDPELS